MDDNNSFLYPQGFHIGALFHVVKNIGDSNFSHPFNPETYSPQNYNRTLGTFERECRYRMWALMEMGILEDHRVTDDHRSYQNLTEKGRRIYELMEGVEFPANFFQRRSNDSWALRLEPIDYIRFTRSLKGACPELFNLLHDTFASMDSCQDLIAHFLFSGKYQITKHELYSTYFSNPIVRDRYTQRGLTPPRDSYETARRRLSIIIKLLQSVDIVSVSSTRVEGVVTLLESSENLTEQRMETIEEKAEETVSEIDAAEIDNQLQELETHLSGLAPKDRVPNPGIKSPAYPRNPRVVALKKIEQNYTCQVCNEVGFEKPDGLKFISHHHMIPMNKGVAFGSNPDVPSNILIVCSWCHDKLEYGTREIKESIYNDLLRREIINQDKIDDLRQLEII